MVDTQRSKFSNIIKPAIQLMGILIVTGALIGIPIGVMIFCIKIIGGI